MGSVGVAVAVGVGVVVVVAVAVGVAVGVVVGVVVLVVVAVVVAVAVAVGGNMISAPKEIWVCWNGDERAIQFASPHMAVATRNLVKDEVLSGPYILVLPDETKKKKGKSK